MHYLNNLAAGAAGPVFEVTTRSFPFYSEMPGFFRDPRADC